MSQPSRLWEKLRRPTEITAVLGALAFAAYVLPGSPWNPNRLENRVERVKRELLDLGRAPEGWLFSIPEAEPPRGTPQPIPEELQIATEQLLENPEVRREDKAVLYLLVGNPQGAIEEFEKALAETSESEHYRLLNDLAVAQMEAAEKADDPRELLEAFSALEQALQRQPERPEVLFNRALNLDRLLLSEPARPAWNEFLEREPSSAWTRKARLQLETRGFDTERSAWSNNLPRLRAAALAGQQNAVKEMVFISPQLARLWAEEGDEEVPSLLGHWARSRLKGDLPRAEEALTLASAVGQALAQRSGERMLLESIDSIQAAHGSRFDVLIAGHAEYQNGLDSIVKGEYSRAAGPMKEAARLLANGGSPFAYWASYRLALCDYQDGNYRRAFERFEPWIDELDSQRFPSLWAKSRHLIGVMRAIQGDFRGAQDYEEAGKVFERLRETGHAAKDFVLLSELAMNVGNLPYAWQSAWRSLSQAQQFGEGDAQYYAYETLARIAQNLDRPALALAYQSEAVRIARDRLEPVHYRVSALRYRAVLQRAAGQPDLALKDLDEATAVATRVEGAAERTILNADLAFTHGQLLRRQDPRRALATLSEAIASYRDTSYHYWLAYLLMERGRTLANLGDLERAEADFEEALEEMERQRDTITDSLDRRIYSDQRRALFEEIIQFQAETRARPDLALEIVERFRGHSLAASGTGGQSGITDAQARLAKDMALVEFIVLPREIRIWVIRRDRTSALSPIVLDRKALRAKLETFQQHLKKGVREEIRSIGGALYREIWAPLEPELRDVSRVILVRDQALIDFPFAALWDAEKGSFLIERHALIDAPSARVYSASADQGFEPESSPRILLFADPAVSPTYSLDRLPWALEEAREIADLFSRATLQASEKATQERFLALADSFDIFHYTGHAAADLQAPERSRLFLAGDADEGTLTGEEVLQMHFSRLRLAVLAGCQTGAGLASASEGTVSLARLFHAAGVPTVLSSLKPIKDAGAKVFIVRFYRHLQAGLPISEALQKAQAESINDLPPSLWAGFALSEAAVNR